MIKEMFPDAFAEVFFSHRQFKLSGGHDIYHAIRVAETAYRIAINEWNNEHVAQLAGLAGLCHNADRVAQKMLNFGRQPVPEQEIKILITFWLGNEGGLSPGDLREVINAVLKHENQNSKQDSKVLIALRDADRVVNLDLDLVIRSGQHYHDVPAVDFEHFLDDPNATYSEPRSSLRDIAYALDWVDEKSPYCICTSFGRKLGEERAIALRGFIDTLRKQLEETGLLSARKEQT